MFYGGYLRNGIKVILCLLLVALLTVIAQLIYPNYPYSLMASGVMIPIAFSFLAIFKGLFYLFLRKFHIKYALVCGPKKEADAIAKKVLFDDTRFTQLKYVIYDTNDDLSCLYTYIDEVDSVYLTEKLSPETKNLIISYCFKTQKPYFLVPKLYELALNSSAISQVSDTLVFSIKGLGLSVEQRVIKRIFDLVVSLPLAIILLPFMLIIALIIKLYDGGPVFFKQKRMTRFNKPFILYKFRSMIPDAERLTGAVQASKNDNRITPFGKLLRATRLDELPQLINVIKGEMSLVGPRALRVEEIEEFAKKDAEFVYRLNVKAGVTGYAQIMGRYYTHFRDKLHFDVFYIINYSFFNDLVIILQTVRSIFDPKSSEGLSQKLSLAESLDQFGLKLVDSKNDHIKLIEKK